MEIPSTSAHTHTAPRAMTALASTSNLTAAALLSSKTYFTSARAAFTLSTVSRFGRITGSSLPGT